MVARHVAAVTARVADFFDDAFRPTRFAADDFPFDEHLLKFWARLAFGAAVAVAELGKFVLAVRHFLAFVNDLFDRLHVRDHFAAVSHLVAAAVLAVRAAVGPGGGGDE